MSKVKSEAVDFSESGTKLIQEKKFKSNKKGCCFGTEENRKVFYGLLLVFSIAIAWVGAQQLSQSAVRSFYAPFFTTWFSTCWMVLCFPFYCLLTFATVPKRNWSQNFQETKQIFSPDEFKIKSVLLKVFTFTVIWVATNYCYVFALSYIAASDASAIISSNVAIVYVMSVVMLKERFYIFRILAVLLSIAGVVLFAYADGFGSNGSSNLVGVLLALASAFGSAGYKVLFKRAIYKGNLGQICLFLSILGVLNAVCLWFIQVILYFTKVEYFTAEDIPWDFLCSSSALSLAFNFLVNFGVAYTYPLFISIAMMLGIPLNAMVDLLFRGEIFSGVRLGAALLVIISFAFMLIPIEFNYTVHKLVAEHRRLPRCDVRDQDDDVTDYTYNEDKSCDNEKSENPRSTCM